MCSTGARTCVCRKMVLSPAHPSMGTVRARVTHDAKARKPTRSCPRWTTGHEGMRDTQTNTPILHRSPSPDLIRGPFALTLGHRRTDASNRTAMRMGPGSSPGTMCEGRAGKRSRQSFEGWITLGHLNSTFIPGSTRNPSPDADARTAHRWIPGQGRSEEDVGDWKQEPNETVIPKTKKPRTLSGASTATIERSPTCSATRPLPRSSLPFSRCPRRRPCARNRQA